MANLKERSNVKFAKILAKTGKLHIECDPDEKGATERTVEKSDTGETKTFIEKLYDEVSGKISSLEIKDSDYGRVLYIGIDNEIVITVGTSNHFGTALLKKIPLIDVEKEVTFAPFSFTGDKQEMVRGVTVSQEGNKIDSFFQEGKGKDTKNINGYPDVDESKKPERTAKTAWKKFWKKYFDEVDDFLVEYTTKNHTIEYVEEEDEDTGEF